MNLDPITIGVIVGMTAFMSSIAFALIHHSRLKARGAAHWATFSFLLAVGLFVGSFNNILGPVYSVFFADVIYIASLSFVYLGVRELTEEEAPSWMLLGFFWMTSVSFLYYSNVLYPDAMLSITIISLAVALLTAASAYQIYKKWNWYSTGKISLFALFIFTSLFMVIKSLSIHVIEFGIADEGFIKWVVASGLIIQFSLVWFIFSVILIATEKINDDLDVKGLIDPLTGLLNQNGLEATAQRVIKRNQRTQTSVALMMIDIDFFKEMNDVYGYAHANSVLQQVANIIGNTLRFEDYCSRYDADVFVALLEGANASDVILPAQRILHALEEEDLKVDNTLVPCTVSIGIAISTGEGDLYDLLYQCDEVLQQIKLEGGNNYRVSDMSSDVIVEMPVDAAS